MTLQQNRRVNRNGYQADERGQTDQVGSVFTFQIVVFGHNCRLGMAWKGGGKNKDLQRKAMNPHQRENSEYNKRMNHKLSCHNNHLIQCDFRNSMGKGFRQIGADDQKGQRHADVAKIGEGGFRN